MRLTLPTGRTLGLIAASDATMHDRCAGPRVANAVDHQNGPILSHGVFAAQQNNEVLIRTSNSRYADIRATPSQARHN